jgi:integrase
MGSLRVATDTTRILPILFTSKTLKNGTHPILLRVTQGTQRSYKSTGYGATVAQWDKKNQCVKNSHPDHEAINEKIAAMRYELNSIRTTLQKSDDSSVTVRKITASLTAEVLMDESVLKFMVEDIESLKKGNQLGTAQTRHYAYSRLKAFLNKKDLRFSELDYTKVKQFATDLKSRKLSPVSMNQIFRSIRAVFNEAIKSKKANGKDYPFDKFEVSQFSTKTKKRNIRHEDLIKIERLELNPEAFIYDARNVLMFTFYGYGISFTDMVQLRWSNIVNDRIVFTRQKTGTEIDFPILPPLKNIIDYYRMFTGSNAANYILPFLNKEVHKTPVQINYRVKKVLKRVNKELKTIATNVGLNVPLTTYYGRHTFARVLRDAGFSMNEVAEALFHDDKNSTTKIYAPENRRALDDKIYPILMKFHAN